MCHSVMMQNISLCSYRCLNPIAYTSYMLSDSYDIVIIWQSNGMHTQVIIPSQEMNDLCHLLLEIRGRGMLNMYTLTLMYVLLYHTVAHGIYIMLLPY